MPFDYPYHSLIDDGTNGSAAVEKVLEWRRDVVWTAASRDRSLQRKLVRCCKEDVIFFFKGFVDLYEPRPDDDGAGEPRILPFIPWPHQVEAIVYADEWLGKRDIRVNKSRAQGASYLYSMILFHRWLFQPMFKANIVSKDQDAADNPKDPDSVMWKIVFALESLPEWMRGEEKRDWLRSIKDHTLTNFRNGSVLRAYACTPNVGSGGRAAVFFMDEIAKFPRAYDSDAVTSTQQITRCRIFCSSPYGADGAYFRLMHDETARDPIQKLSWIDNPTQNRGMYHLVKDKPHMVDFRLYGKPPRQYYDPVWWADLRRRLEDRGYDVSKGYRSPWYDNECLRTGANPISIAQELDMRFTNESARYFPDTLVDRLLRDTAKQPVARGELSFTIEDFTKPRWLEMQDGRFLLWFSPELGRSPPPDLYVVSADVSMGLGGVGGSNSSLTVFNRRTGRKVGAFVVPNMLPYRFAEVAVATCYWFQDEKGSPAYMAWEDNGPGKEFGKRVRETDFRDFYYRKVRDVLTNKSTNKPGYWTQRKSELLGPYREALIEGRYVNPDATALEELRQYSVGQDGEPFHNEENTKDDPTGAKRAHADRVISDAVGWIAALDFGRGVGTVQQALNVVNVTKTTAPADSYAYRRAMYLEDSMKMRRKSKW